MPIEEHTYREAVKEKFERQDERMKEFETDMRNSLMRIETTMTIGFKGVHARQDTANSKVNKIIIALVAVTFLAIGLGINNSSLIASLILAL